MIVLTARSDFEKLAILRMREAKLLLDQMEWDGAYYLAGYAVEFALKARIISQLMKSDVFPSKNQADNFYKHGLKGLRELAQLDTEMDNDAVVKDLWLVVKDWTEQARYQIGKTERETTDFYDAIEKGVLPWIKARW